MEDGDAEIFDCAMCRRPESFCQDCPIDEQPKFTPAVNRLLILWRRMQRYHGLPGAGGLEDQEERLMVRLDLIADEVDRRDRRKAQIAEQEHEKALERVGRAGTRRHQRGIR